jgi:hypothetical protein
MHKVALNATLITQLHELVSAPFTLPAFNERWNQFGWTYEPADDDEFGFRVRVSNDLMLGVDPLGNNVLLASLPFVYWEKYDPRWHPSAASYSLELEEYNSEYLAARGRTRDWVHAASNVGLALNDTQIETLDL